ncbi:hypothetical protein [Pelagibius marinus]|uniref:hypothetical protein n=1 Tax=Pelagibius marinus TaxID=2762760 RepID=UPI0018727661|nr:hypothetical protein [Pelagibius marinus]
MALLDNSFNARAAGLIGRWEQRWEHPRLLALAFVLALGSSVNAMVSGGLLEDPWKKVALFGEGTEVAGAFGAGNVDQAKACGRIHQIVETACGLKQYDHDSDGIRQCIAYERRYTMWSAYGCR